MHLLGGSTPDPTDGDAGLDQFVTRIGAAVDATGGRAEPTMRFLKELMGNNCPGASRTRRFIDAVEVHLRTKVVRWMARRTTPVAGRDRITERPSLVVVDPRCPRVRGSA